MRVHHVNVVVSPGTTDAAVAFYVDVLGLRRIAKPSEGTAGGGAWLELPDGSAQVHLSERDGAAHPDQHFALVVDDLDAVLERAAAAGAPWTYQPEMFGGRRGFTRDPAGNRIELIDGSS